MSAPSPLPEDRAALLHADASRLGRLRAQRLVGADDVERFIASAIAALHTPELRESMRALLGESVNEAERQCQAERQAATHCIAALVDAVPLAPHDVVLGMAQTWSDTRNTGLLSIEVAAMVACGIARRGAPNRACRPPRPAA